LYKGGNITSYLAGKRGGELMGHGKREGKKKKEGGRFCERSESLKGGTVS